MFLPRVFLSFAVKLFQCPDYAETGIARLDDIINVTITCSIVRVAEQVIVFRYLPLCGFSPFFIVLKGLDLFGI